MKLLKLKISASWVISLSSPHLFLHTYFIPRFNDLSVEAADSSPYFCLLPSFLPSSLPLSSLPSWLPSLPPPLPSSLSSLSSFFCPFLRRMRLIYAITIYTPSAGGCESRLTKRCREELPTSEVRGSGLECQAAMAQERPRGATPRPRSGRRPGGDTPCARSEVARRRQNSS